MKGVEKADNQKNKEAICVISHGHQIRNTEDKE
jgi:hypothetical protein